MDERDPLAVPFLILLCIGCLVVGWLNLEAMEEIYHGQQYEPQ